MAFMMFSRALSCRAGSGQGHCTQSGSCKLKPARDKLKTKGQRYAGQERLGFALLPLQESQHSCHGCGHPGLPAGITLNIPQGLELAPQGRMLHAAQPAGLGTWLLLPSPAPQILCRASLPGAGLAPCSCICLSTCFQALPLAGHTRESQGRDLATEHPQHADQPPKVPMEFPFLPMPQQRQKHPLLRFDIAQPLQTLPPTHVPTTS